MHLLDTNILTAIHARNLLVINRLNTLDDPDVATTLITQLTRLSSRRSSALAPKELADRARGFPSKS
jgi:predicted nucleic acid-binding protein